MQGVFEKSNRFVSVLGAFMLSWALICAQVICAQSKEIPVVDMGKFSADYGVDASSLLFDEAGNLRAAVMVKDVSQLNIPGLTDVILDEPSAFQGRMQNELVECFKYFYHLVQNSIGGLLDCYDYEDITAPSIVFDSETGLVNEITGFHTAYLETESFEFEPWRVRRVSSHDPSRYKSRYKITDDKGSFEFFMTRAQGEFVSNISDYSFHFSGQDLRISVKPDGIVMDIPSFYSLEHSYFGNLNPRSSDSHHQGRLYLDYKHQPFKITAEFPDADEPIVGGPSYTIDGKDYPIRYMLFHTDSESAKQVEFFCGSSSSRRCPKLKDRVIYFESVSFIRWRDNGSVEWVQSESEPGGAKCLKLNKYGSVEKTRLETCASIFPWR